MCHGGYFVGAVYVDGKLITHKHVKRYIVRKKQGL